MTLGVRKCESSSCFYLKIRNEDQWNRIIEKLLWRIELFFSISFPPSTKKKTIIFSFEGVICLSSFKKLLIFDAVFFSTSNRYPKYNISFHCKKKHLQCLADIDTNFVFIAIYLNALMQFKGVEYFVILSKLSFQLKALPYILAYKPTRV